MKLQSLPGLIPYERARELQLELVELRARDEIEDTVLFLEHEPVVTRGRGLQFTRMTEGAREKHLPLPGPLPAGVAFSESERGGDLTYHGPGQLVIYPIVKLDGSGAWARHDIGAFLRRFEQCVIAVLDEWTGAEAFSRDGATGVWIRERAGDGAPLRIAPLKIASMGIAVRKWVTYHGLAINCVNDLRPFHLISPCGFAPEVMTRLADWAAPRSELSRAMADWNGYGRAELERRIAERMSGTAPAVGAGAERAVV